MKEFNLHRTLAAVGAGLALAGGLCLASTSAFATAPTSGRSESAGSVGTFVPYWQDVESSPGGCSGPITPGYSISGPSRCGTDSNGNGIVDFVYLFGGSSFSYTVNVPSGSVAHVTYGIPSAEGLGNGSSSFQGGYLTNSPTKVSIDGSPVTTHHQRRRNLWVGMPNYRSLHRVEEPGTGGRHSHVDLFSGS
jgi:hypothetical protein